MKLTLPKFEYFKLSLDNLLNSKVAKKEEFECICCKKKQSLSYTGPAESEDGDSLEEILEKNEKFCFFCIADGKASKKLGIFFNLGGGVFDEIYLEDDDEEEWTSDEIKNKDLKVISEGTPGFWTYQEQKWLTHCGKPSAVIKVPKKNEDKGEVLFQCVTCNKKKAYLDLS